MLPSGVWICVHPKSLAISIACGLFRPWTENWVASRKPPAGFNQGVYDTRRMIDYSERIGDPYSPEEKMQEYQLLQNAPSTTTKHGKGGKVSADYERTKYAKGGKVR
jgi:hypothetical protein